MTSFIAKSTVIVVNVEELVPLDHLSGRRSRSGWELERPKH